MTDQQTPGDDWASITLQAGSPENLAGLLIALAAVHSLDAAAAEPHPHDNCVPRHAYDKLVDQAAGYKSAYERADNEIGKLGRLLSSAQAQGAELARKLAEITRDAEAAAHRIRELEHDAEDYSRLAQALDAAHARIRELEALEAKPATPATRSPRKA